MMLFSLYKKLAVALSIVLISAGLALIWWTAHSEKALRQQAEQKLHIDLAEHLVHENPLLSEGVTDYAALEHLFHMQMVLGPSFEFYFLDPAGKILTYSANPQKIKRQQINLSPIVELINAPEHLPIYGDDPRSLSGRKVFSAAPVYDGDKLQGYLYVIIGGEIYDSVFAATSQDYALKQRLIILGVSLTVLLLALLVLFRVMTRPLKRLSHDIERYRQSGFTSSESDFSVWNKPPRNEIEQLGFHFYQLAERINFQFARLKANDKSRRELLAQLSHDLRTPLSSIHGYIETIALQGHNLNQQQREQYIEIALRGVQQLRRLINQIFELAHIESGQIAVELETFPLGELLFDIREKFALKASEKNIAIKVEPQKFDYQVESDIGKLERVLSNLIENAIRHSSSGDTITIKVEENQPSKQLTISVEDTGSGIAEQDIPYIFDTLYRGGNSVGEKHAHGGFGLAISKKLLELLQSEIQVRSKLGIGTEFSFHLRQVT